MDQHFHPIINQHLKKLFEERDWNGLQTYLDSLSHSHFRTAGYLLGERLLTSVPAEDFWTVVQRLILWQPKAFTVTLAKAATPRLAAGTLSIHDTGLHQLAQALQSDEHVLDREKLLLQWLPTMREPAVMEELFNMFGLQEPRRRVEFLIQTDTPVAAFVLLRSLRFEEHDRKYLTSVCRQLVRRAATLSHSANRTDSLSFNLASLFRTFFDLPDIRGTFSLTIQPYELSRIDTDFEVFQRLITRV